MKWMEKTDLLAWCEQNGERGQQLIEEWNEDKNFNEYGQPVIMQDFCCFSDKKAWWKCRGCGHEWQADPEHGKCVEHGHRYHYHERMQLMRENARRADISAPVVVEEPAGRGTPPVLIRCAPRGITSEQGLPRMYGGYLRPHRC